MIYLIGTIAFIGIVLLLVNILIQLNGIEKKVLGMNDRLLKHYQP